VFQAGGVTRLDFTAQWSPLTIRNRGVARRGSLACAVDGVRRNAGKPGSSQLLADAFDIMVAVRNARQETRGIVGEDCCERFRNDIGELIF